MASPYVHTDRLADIRIDFDRRIRERLTVVDAREIDIHLGYDYFTVECTIDGKSYRIALRTEGMGMEYDLCNKILDAVDALVAERPASSLRTPA